MCENAYEVYVFIIDVKKGIFLDTNIYFRGLQVEYSKSRVHESINPSGLTVKL